MTPEHSPSHQQPVLSFQLALNQLPSNRDIENALDGLTKMIEKGGPKGDENYQRISLAQELVGIAHAIFTNDKDSCLDLEVSHLLAQNTAEPAELLEPLQDSAIALGNACRCFLTPETTYNRESLPAKHAEGAGEVITGLKAATVAVERFDGMRR